MWYPQRARFWRQHRKISAPSFSEKNNELVWNETLHQTQAMLEGWNRHGGLASEVAKDTMTMTLNVISRAGFGVSAPISLPPVMIQKQPRGNQAVVENIALPATRDRTLMTMTASVSISTFEIATTISVAAVWTFQLAECSPIYIRDPRWPPLVDWAPIWHSPQLLGYTKNCKAAIRTARATRHFRASLPGS